MGFYKDAPDSHINTARNIVTTQGVGWYKLVLTPPANAAGRESFLQFDAASRIATVWLNGTLLGTHWGPFSRFRMGVTGALRPGQENTLTVKVDNTKPAPGNATADVLPLTGDFFVYGGLYRPVSLVFTSSTHLDLMDYGSSRVNAKTTSVTSSAAELQVHARIRNDGKQNSVVLLRTLLVHGKRQNCRAPGAERQRDPRASSRAPQPSPCRIPISGRDWRTPYLYRLVIELANGSVPVLDQVSVPFGIRQFRFNPDQGLFLNGKHVPVHGIGCHQDREGKGWASAPEDVAADEA